MMMKPILVPALAALALLSLGGRAAAAGDVVDPGSTLLVPENVGFELVIPGIDAVAAVADGTLGVASGQVILNQSLTGNRVEEEGIDHTASIEGSFLDSRGLVNINQDSGSLNNQANVRVLVFSGSDSRLQLLHVATEADASDNAVVSSGSAREDSIVDSFGGTVGVVGVNQSSGNLNQQSNLLILGAGLGITTDLFLLEEDDLGDVFPEDLVLEGPSGARTETLVGSFSEFQGVAQVTQTSGDLNVLQNVLGISVSVIEGTP
jgi:hypothetical protein